MFIQFLHLLCQDVSNLLPHELLLTSWQTPTMMDYFPLDHEPKCIFPMPIAFCRSLTPPENEAIKRILVQYIVIHSKTNYYNEDKTADDSVTWPATWVHPAHHCFLWHHALMTALGVVPVASGAAVPKTLQGSMLGGWRPGDYLYSSPWTEEMWGKFISGDSTPT